MSLKGKKRLIESFIYILPIFMLVAALLWGRYHGDFNALKVNTFLLIKNLIKGQGPLFMDTDTSVVYIIRLPRAIAGFLIGGCLALSGATLQGIFRNPLVDSNLLGVSSGAGFGAVLAIILFHQTGLVTLVFAFLFGLLAVFLAFMIGSFYKKTTSIMLILGGVIVSSLFSSLISFGKYIADPFDELPEIVFWLMGSLANISYAEIQFVFLPILLGSLGIMYFRRQINILSMGDKEALSMGVNTGKLKAGLIMFASLITAASICIAGTIGWIGLIIPHIIRMLIGNDNSKLIPLSFFLGGSFLMFIDIIARTLTSAEIPIGILTSLIGAPFYIGLLRKTKGGNW